MEWINYFY